MFYLFVIYIKVEKNNVHHELLAGESLWAETLEDK